LNEEVYKGCSTFKLSEDLKCSVVHNNTIEGELYEYGVCKQTCSGNNCNSDHVRPCAPLAGDDCSAGTIISISTFLLFLTFCIFLQ